jgi:hypothetical protein
MSHVGARDDLHEVEGVLVGREEDVVRAPLLDRRDHDERRVAAGQGEGDARGGLRSLELPDGDGRVAADLEVGERADVR